MKVYRLLLVAAAIFPSCHRPDHHETTNMNLQARNDISGLAAFMNIPGTPLKARWLKIERSKNSTLGSADFILFAVLEYDTSEAGTLIKKMGAPPDNETIALTAAQAGSLFSPDQTKNMRKIEGDDVEAPGKLFGAELFAKAPFLHGKAVAVEGSNLLLISLFTM